MNSSTTKRQQNKAVDAFTAQTLCPLFIPLYTRFYEQFAAGTKKIEYRTYGPGWNERTCLVGRRVTLSKGYGKYARMSAVITRFQRRGTEALIHLAVQIPAAKAA